MRTLKRRRGDQRGQMMPLFALSFTVLLLFAGLAVDATYALSQRRTAQNAADFAALAGTRIVAKQMSGDASGTDANVVSAINAALSANRAQAVTYGGAKSPRYIASDGTTLGYVGTGTIPSSPAAAGVVVIATLSWTPFLLGTIGVTNWT